MYGRKWRTIDVFIYLKRAIDEQFYSYKTQYKYIFGDRNHKSTIYYIILRNNIYNTGYENSWLYRDENQLWDSASEVTKNYSEED